MKTSDITPAVTYIKTYNMEIKKITLVYFSATYTTRKVVRALAQMFGCEVEEHDVTDALPDSAMNLGRDGELLIVGMPVYAGRIPRRGAEALDKVKGDGAPAIAVCVYGNRDYDDALLELNDTLTTNGFKVIAAGAFIAQHSIFPQLAAGRPDKDDMAKLEAFGKRCKDKLDDWCEGDITIDLRIKGNRPYKKPGAVPLHPHGDKNKCNECRTCAKLCPTGAIDAQNPCHTDGSKCISCGRCVAVCPQHARHFGGILYSIAEKKIVGGNRERKEPEWFTV